MADKGPEGGGLELGGPFGGLGEEGGWGPGGVEADAEGRRCGCCGEEDEGGEKEKDGKGER